MLAGLGFTVLVDDVMERNGIVGADPVIYHFVLRNRTSTLNDIFRFTTHLGGIGVVAPLGLLVVTLLVWRRHRILAFGVIAATGGSALVIAILKLLVDRSRPALITQLVVAHGTAFPSGHSAESIACYGMLAWIVFQLTSSRAVRVVVGAVAAFLAVAVGLSRIYLGVHWASDVLSGWFVGIAWLAAAIAVCSVLSRPLVGGDSTTCAWRVTPSPCTRRKLGSAG